MKDWVRELVVLVMLAGSLELLIPTGGMKKYVRTAMGLLVVLSVAKPVVALLGAPISVADGERLVGRATAIPASGLPSLGQVMDQAQRFRERNMAMAQQHGKRALEETARAAALRVAGVQEATVTVELDLESADLRRVLVRITPGPAGGPRRVNPVRPVRRSEAENPPLPISPDLRTEILRAVAAALGLEPGDARILVELYGEPLESTGGSRP